MTLTYDEPVSQSVRSPSRRWAQALVPPLLAMVVSWALIAFRGPLRGAQLLAPTSFARWDSGQYLGIARSGYYATWNCPPHGLPPHLPPGRYLCGTIGWFPGYPFATRGVSDLTGLSQSVAAMVIAWVCWYLLLALMWRLLAGARSTPTRWMCLLIAAFFPGYVYFAALFPVSLCIAGILASLYIALCTSRRALAWVGLATGFIAAYSYITAIVLAPALLIVGLLVVRGRRRFQMIVPAIGAALGFVAVLVTMQVAVHIWDAYFISTKKYDVGAHQPLTTLLNRLRPLWAGHPVTAVQTATARQTLVTLCLVAAVCIVTIAAAVRSQRAPDGPTWSEAITSRISVFDLTFLLMTVGVWLVPYIAGGSASTYRSEAFVVVAVPLLRRLPAWLLVIPLAAVVWVAWNIIPNFVNGQLH